MKIAYVDCFHGAAGDMLLASLLDAGLEQQALEAIITTLPLSGYTIEHQRTTSHHIRGSIVHVHVHSPQPSRTWQDIRTMLQESQLPQRTRAWAMATFERLARAEATIHHEPIDDVHFHEVGAVDSIIDIVGVCAGLELLGIDHIYASPLPSGSGWVATQHGLLPVPAPATLALLAEVGAPIVPSSSTGEILTPTAAALLCELAHFEQPPMRIHTIGYGFGHKSYDCLNGLRVWIGSAFAKARSHSHSDKRETTPDEFLHEHVVEMRCNLDDSTGEIIAYTIKQLMEAGALDAWATPIVMKKGRPAVQLCCLAHGEDVEPFAQLILRETPTLGIRWEIMQRMVAERQTVFVQTHWGEIRLKQKILAGKIIATSPEYEDCAAIASTRHIPLADVYAAALQAQGGDKYIIP